MKNVILFILFFLVSIPAARAQLAPQPTTPRPLGEVTDTPVCSRLVNKAPYTVLGAIVTEAYISADGVYGRHRSNFWLKPEKTKEFCTTGPFFEGRTLELSLRTLFPVFSCKTGVGGDIVIRGRYKDKSEGGGAETWAECLGGTAEEPAL